MQQTHCFWDDNNIVSRVWVNGHQIWNPLSRTTKQKMSASNWKENKESRVSEFYEVIARERLNTFVYLVHGERQKIDCRSFLHFCYITLCHAHLSHFINHNLWWSTLRDKSFQNCWCSQIHGTCTALYRWPFKWISTIAVAQVRRKYHFLLSAMSVTAANRSAHNSVSERSIPPHCHHFRGVRLQTELLYQAACKTNWFFRLEP